ncbi:MAG: hypothetical protein V8S27_00220 [Lachnospiraceae bacterium]
MTMEENKKNLAEGDWELSEEYYHQDSSEKTLNLEDFIEAEEPDGSEETFGKDDELGVELSRVAEQDTCRRWSLRRRECLRRKLPSVSESRLPMLRDIAVCVQAFPEDNPMAVARLLVLG